MQQLQTFGSLTASFSRQSDEIGFKNHLINSMFSKRIKLGFLWKNYLLVEKESVCVSHHVLFSVHHGVGGQHRSLHRAAPEHALQLTADAADPERLAPFRWVPAHAHRFHSCMKRSRV